MNQKVKRQKYVPISRGLSVYYSNRTPHSIAYAGGYVQTPAVAASSDRIRVCCVFIAHQQKNDELSIILEG